MAHSKINCHDQPALIMGAGPSLPHHLTKLKSSMTQKAWDSLIKIGINHHASRLVSCDYIYYNDDHTFKWYDLPSLPGLKVSRFKDQADIFVDGTPRVLSAILALRWVQSLGAAPIYLAGFDLTQKHFYDSGNCNALPTTDQINFWWSEDPKNVICLGGPLVEQGIFKGEN